MPPYTDQLGLVITTESAGAAAYYAEGVELLLRSSPRKPDVSQPAAVGRTRRSAWRSPRLVLSGTAGQPVADEDMLGSAERSLAGSSSATRRERQHIEIVAIALGGDSTSGQASDPNICRVPR